jgi:hypothetical protein
LAQADERLSEINEFVDEIPDGKKTNLEWEQLLRARFVPPDSDDDAPTTVDADYDQTVSQEPVGSAADADPANNDHADSDRVEDADEDCHAAYREPVMVPSGMVSTGDLLRA